ncbi:MAG TPA: LysR family transcriptional regulator [Caulobacteraceae bacterium]
MSEWDGIDAFVAVARTLNFSQASKRLGRSTSQVSREISRLEERLGVRLFHRTTRHVSLTDLGDRFLGRCRRLIEDRNEAMIAIAAEAGQLHGHLRVTCSVAYGERFVVPLLNAFLAEHPKLTLEIELTDNVLDLVGGGFDFAIRAGQLKDSRLIARRLASRTRILCAAPGYLRMAGAPRELADLRDHACLRGTSDSWTFSRNGREAVFKPNGRWRANSGAAVLDAALRGLGICQLPDFYLTEALASGHLVRLLEAYQPADEGVWGVYPDRRQLSPKVRLALEHLQRHLGQGQLGPAAHSSSGRGLPRAGRAAARPMPEDEGFGVASPCELSAPSAVP